jgi:hypothetical protein
MDLLGEVEAGKRRRNAIYYAAAAGVFFLLMIVVIVSSEYDDLGLGTINNTVVTWLNLLFLVSSTIAMVKSCRLRTPKGGITHWKLVGLFALILWGSVIVLWLAMFLSPVIALFSVLILAMIPSLVWFPIWTGVSAIRGARNPDRLTPMRVGVKATLANEPFLSNESRAAPTLGHSDSSTVTESEAAPAAQASDQGRVETRPGVVGKSKRPNGWIIGAIASGSLLVGVAITLVVLSAGQAPEQSAEQQAEVLAIKACGIEEVKDEEVKDEETGSSKWTDNDGSGSTDTWYGHDALEELVSRKKFTNEDARYAARAERLDNYWAPLANDAKKMYLSIKNIVDSRELHMPGYTEALKDHQIQAWYSKDDRVYEDLVPRWQ